MKLTKKIELGINAVKVLRAKDTPTRLEDIALLIDGSENFLSQVMRVLRSEGIVSVKRGPGGGYFIAKDTKITAYHVAKALGRDFGVLSLDESPMSRLGRAITEAFLNTTI